MKKKVKYILFLFVSIFLIISIFKENISSVSAASNITTAEKFTLNEKITSNKKKIVYLTFDDGPSYKVTNKILDILKENQVKATFFLLGNQIECNEDVVKRIYDEGNSIGIHSYTHDYEKIYSSEDIFIQEMIECRNEINKVIGISPNIIRFPGGSENRLSESFLKRLHDNNFKIYDWNLDATDGINPKLSPNKIYRKVKNGSENLQTVILLMHCTDANKNTYKALPKIIKYYNHKDTNLLLLPKIHQKYIFL